VDGVTHFILQFFEETIDKLTVKAKKTFVEVR